MSTRQERREQREKRAEMACRFPACRWCRKPCVCGQVDGMGEPAHYGCQMAFLLRRKPHPGAVINPKLPQYQQTSTGTVPVGKEETL